MASPHGYSPTGRSGRSPNNTMSGSDFYHECPMADSYTSKWKERAFCARQENTAMKDLTASSMRPFDQEENEELDNERRTWEHSMKEFQLGVKPQRGTAVLMISWAKELDDLHTEEEVNELEAVFSKLFNYTVMKRQISGDKPPAIQLSKYLSDFVWECDNESTLLIVYYAGHGVPKVPGGLHFAGNRQPDKKLSNRTAAAWHDVEHIIRDAEGDALLIFDCCYAGNLTLRDVRSSRPTRSFEYIAACGSTDETNFPGPESFTSAMIWALENLVKSQKRFTTLELQNKIMTEAPSFPRKQSVLVMERDDSCDQRLVLAPLPSPASGMSTTSAQLLDEMPQNHLDLRFWYQDRPDGSEIENLANRLKRLMKAQNIGARSVSWLGLTSHRATYLNGNAGPSNSIGMSRPSASNDSRSSSSHQQASLHSSVKCEHSPATRTMMKEIFEVAVEEKSFVASFGLIKRGCQGIIWQIFRSLKPRVLPIFAVLSLGLYARYGFPCPSFPFKIY